MRDPRELALRIRLRAVRMVAALGMGYLGQALSSAEQVAAVFGCARPGVDRLVCSPGHYVIGPFAAAAELGLLDEDLVAGYGQDGSAVEAIRQNGFLEAPILGRDAEAAAALDRSHADPVDRLLVAQAQLGSLTLATADKVIRGFGGVTQLKA